MTESAAGLLVRGLGTFEILSMFVPEDLRGNVFPSVYPSLENVGQRFDRFARAHDSYEIWAKTRVVGRRMKAFAFPGLVEDGGK